MSKPDAEPLFDWANISQSTYEPDEARIADIFHQIDVVGDGFVTVEEFRTYFDKKGQQHTRLEIEKIIARGDIKKDGRLDYQEFMLFMLEHERNLFKHFKQLDKDDNGQISFGELCQYFESEGMDVPQEKVREFIARLDKNDNLEIGWDEFREFNQFKLNYHLSFTHQYASAYVDGIIDCKPVTSAEENSSSFLKSFVCGGFAGLVSRTCTAPLDRVKVLLQVQRQQKVVGGTNGGNLGFVRMFKAMYREGLWTMWRGNTVNCLKIFPENAMRLMLFEWLKQQNYAGNFVNGAVTGMTVQTIMYPVEFAKTRIMTETAADSKRSLSSKLRKMAVNEHGKIQVFRGCIPAVLGSIPFASLELGLSRTLTDWYKSYFDEVSPGFWTLASIGGSSTGVAMTSTYPIRLITCQMQAYKGPEADRPKFYPRLKKIVKSDGYRGLYRGFLANSSKVLPASALSWFFYSKGKEIWEESFQNTRTKY